MSESEPRIETKGAFRLAGCYYAGKNEHNEIPALWEKEFLPRVDEVLPEGAVGFACYGACRMPEDPAALEPGAFEYLASVEVPSLEGLPKGMAGWEVPAQTYAVLRADGVPDIPRVFDYLYTTWAPQSEEWQPGDGPCFEFYPTTFPEDEGIDIYVPVRPRAA